MIAPAARAALREALGDAVRFGVPLRRFTSLRVGGPADAVVTPADRGELSRALVACAAHAIPHCVLGGGFNTIAREGGVDGVVLVMRKLRGLALRDDGTIRAEAGVSHNTLTKLCIANGRSGLEFGAGIPGTIGGWVAMNHAVGTPMISVMKVVIIDNDSDRQKIDRCASAHISVSSKISRCSRTDTQPSVENSHLTLP